MATSYYPPNTPVLTPYLTVQDAEKSIAFYQGAFGFETREVVRNEKNHIMHVEMTLNGQLIIMFCPETTLCEDMGMDMKSPKTTGTKMPLTLYIYHPDVDAIAAKAREHGAVIQIEPADMFWGDRMTQLVDPDGYVWSFAKFLGDS